MVRFAVRSVSMETIFRSYLMIMIADISVLSNIYILFVYVSENSVFNDIYNKCFYKSHSILFKSFSVDAVQV